VKEQSVENMMRYVFNELSFFLFT